MSRDDWRVYTSTGEDGTEYTVYDFTGPTLRPYESERVGYPARCVQCEAPCPCDGDETPQEKSDTDTNEEGESGK